ncbi:MAG: hypothetical protein ACRDQH_11285, partial [Pseudonocardiaceae bacterium]
MGRFEDNLWRDLVREHGAKLATAERPEAGRASFLKRPRVLAGGSLGLAGVGTALVLALSAGGAAAPPAFAITSHSDGSLSINLDDPGQGLVGTNNQLAKMGDNEHIQFTMAHGPATSPGAVDCVASPQGATVSGPAISLTVGPGNSNTETIASGNTGAGTWHVASCQRYNGAETMHVVLVGGPKGESLGTVHLKGARRLRVAEPANLGRASTPRDSSTGPVAFNLDTDGGLVGVNRKLAAMGTDEHVYFMMAQGPAAARGVVDCAPADSSVGGPPVALTVGSGDSNTETIVSGNTGAGTW